MFCPIEVPPVPAQARRAAALVVLTPAESRRLLAKATVALPAVQHAFRRGTIIVARGITNAFVLEELLGTPVQPKAEQTVGLVCGGMTTGYSGPPATSAHVIRDGQVVEGADSRQEILTFGPEDVFIKGGNAVDASGDAGILTSGATGGTIGMAWPIVTTRGSHLVMPVGLEKLVPSVMAAARCTGIHHFKWSMGLPARLTPVPLATVLTEIQALALLAGVHATHVASGGVGGSEGAVVLSLEGEESRVDAAFELVKAIKGEPPVAAPRTMFVESAADFGYEPAAQLATLSAR